MRRATRLSRFSVNVNPQFSKNLQAFISKQALDERDKGSINELTVDSLTTKRSIMLEDRWGSKDLKTIDENPKEQKEEDLFARQNNAKKDKFYDIEEISKYRRSMLELPSLHDKNKKTKYKFISPEFIEFFFQILKSVDVIQKIFSSSVPQQSVVNQFLSVLSGFQMKKIQSGKTMQFNRQDDYFHILIEGAAQKVVVKETIRSERKHSITEYSSETSIVRRSKLKHKTVTEKGKLLCFDKNLPILVNQKELISITLKSIGNCTFILLDKGVWAKFLMALQKLQEKHLVGFIKDCTTINLNTYTNKEKQKNKEDKIQRKRFLHDLKYPNQKCIDEENENDEFQKQQNERRGTIYGNPVGLAYKLFTLCKDQRMKINNQDVYLIAKGSLYLTTELYSMIINEGSIINSSILLDLNYREIKVKALAECLIAKIILDEVYFQKQDEQEFIAKIEEIEQFRCQINCKSNKENIRTSFQSIPVKKSLNGTNQTVSSQKYFALLQNQSLQKNKKFQPKELKLKEMSFIRGTQNKKISPKKERISRCRKFQTQPESHETQLARKVAVKYANNFCVFEKIVESQQKVIQFNNMNKVKKIFPFQELLKSLNFSKFLEKQTPQSHKKHQKKVNFSKNVETEHQRKNEGDHENDIEKMHSDYLKNSKISRQSSKSNRSKKSKSKENYKTLRTRREKFGRSLMDKKKREKTRIMDNLFDINPVETQQNRFSVENNRKQNVSLNLHKQKIKEIVQRNSKIKLKDIQSDRSFFDLRGPIQQNSQKLNLTEDSFGRISKYNRQFLVTEPNYAEIRTLQKAISGQKLPAQCGIIKFDQKFRKSSASAKSIRHMNLTCDGSVFTEDYLKLRKRTTRRIQTTMLTGRIRQARGAQ